MPGTTPRHYPYPLDGESIDVAGDIRRLAEAVDADVATVGTGGGTGGGGDVVIRQSTDGVAYPPRGAVPATGCAIWTNHLSSTPPAVGGDGAKVNVDLIFVLDGP